MYVVVLNFWKLLVGTKRTKDILLYYVSEKISILIIDVSTQTLKLNERGTVLSYIYI